jgi:spore germination protein GerM
MKREHFHPTSRETIISLVALFLTAVGGTAWWIWQINAPPRPQHLDLPSQQEQLYPPASAPTPKAQQSQPHAIALKPEVYWVEVVGNQAFLKSQVMDSPSATSEIAALETALTNLLKGTSTSDLTTAIPSQTRLLGLRMVLYTATSTNPQAKVFLSLDGQPLDEDHPLGGEGLMLRHPLTRQSFQQDFPPS